MIALLFLLQQAAPSRAPLVGDTVWLSRTVSLGPGAGARAPAWTPGGDVELLAPGTTNIHDGVVDLRFPVVVWAPGAHVIDVPGPLILRPDGSIDSVGAAPVTVTIRSILPDSVTRDSVEAQPPAPVLPPVETDPRPLLIWLGGGTLLALGILLFRRRPRAAEVPLPVEAPAPAPPIARWAAAGEARAACEIGALRLRVAIHRGFEPADPRLDTGALLRLIEGSRPLWPVAEIRRVLGALDQVRFGASGGGGDVGPLLEDAERLAGEVGGGG